LYHAQVDDVYFLFLMLDVFLIVMVFQKVIAEMNRKAFLIAQEIVQSEETFIQVLRLLNEVCSAVLTFFAQHFM